MIRVCGREFQAVNIWIIEYKFVLQARCIRLLGEGVPGFSNACNNPNWPQIRTAAIYNVEMIR
jgi:hypothetical protein